MSRDANEPIELRSTDALVVIDVQNDFLPGGSLAVPEGDAVVPVLNCWIEVFRNSGLPIFATRDWHPANHGSFKENGGIWPVHCVVGSHGARFSPDLRLPDSAIVIDKDTLPDTNFYSGLQGTDLEERLKSLGSRRLYIGGLATDYCVVSTVKDALKLGFEVRLLREGIRAVDVHPGDGEKAIREMVAGGAVLVEGGGGPS